MKLIILCEICGTAKELGGKGRYQEINSYQISNDSNFALEISASINGIEDVQETEFDESDLSIEDIKAEFKCEGCNSLLKIEV